MYILIREHITNMTRYGYMYARQNTIQIHPLSLNRYVHTRLRLVLNLSNICRVAGLVNTSAN